MWCCAQWNRICVEQSADDPGPVDRQRHLEGWGAEGFGVQLAREQAGRACGQPGQHECVVELEDGGDVVRRRAGDWGGVEGRQAVQLLGVRSHEFEV